MRKAKRTRQNVAFLCGLSLGLICLIVLIIPQGEKHLMPGPSNSGHQDVACRFCHLSATGTIRQQLQDITSYALGKRALATDFGFQAVTNEHCISCHKRPDDRHPVYRFFEPRYKEVRNSLKPQHCISCHQEHLGVRVTQQNIGYCVACHEKLVLKEDPLSISHQQLIREKKWSSCLGCHDFHGNHKMKTRTKVADVIDPAIIHHYFQGGKSPSSDQKYYKASKEPES